jgi:uncharacterized repeat protein (TIGR01451 family)
MSLGEGWRSIPVRLLGATAVAVAALSTVLGVTRSAAATQGPGANLQGQTVYGSPSNIDLAGANMQDAALLGDFAGANFQGANLQGADLTRVTSLAGADFQGANAQSADLPSGVSLQGANLQGATFQGDSLRDDNIGGSSLQGTNLQGTNLNGADLTGAQVGGVNWNNSICPDATNSNNDGHTCVGHLTAAANLSVKLTDTSGGSVAVGHPISYSVTIENLGPSDATNMTALDTLPIQGLSNISSPALPPNVSFNVATDAWILGTLSAGSTQTLSLSGTVPSNATGASYANKVTASASDAPRASATDTDQLLLPPVVNNLTYTTAFQTALSQPAAGGLLSGATSPAGLPLTVAALGGVAVPTTETLADGGALQVNADGSFVYTPAAMFVGTDVFTFTVSDSFGNVSLPATVTFQVHAPSPPVVNNLTYSTGFDTRLTQPAAGGLLSGATSPAGLPLTVATLDGFGVPSSGSAEVGLADGGALLVSSDGSFIYVPAATFVGTDVFTFTVSDSLGDVSLPATVTFNVT